MSSDDMTGGSRSAPPLMTTARKRGFFGKLKDKAIGTKEEREAEKRRWAEVSMIQVISFSHPNASCSSKDASTTQR
jgi:hypothetical protein